MSGQVNMNEQGARERDDSQFQQQSQLDFDSSSLCTFNSNILQSTAAIPELILPECSDDLLVPQQHALFAVQIYEQLHRIMNNCTLDFHLEDFCAAISANDSDASVTGVAADIHVGLLQILSTHSVDNYTWPTVANRLYAMAHREKIDQQLLAKLGQMEYQSIGIGDRLKILQFLVDQFLESATYRKWQESINCSSCSSESGSVDITATESFRCESCQAKIGSVRNECFGCDRHGREYRFIDRRIFVIDKNAPQTWYYSTCAQLQQLLSTLAGTAIDRKLRAKIAKKRKAIECQMTATESRTILAKGKKVSYFEMIANPSKKAGKQQVMPFRLGMGLRQQTTFFKEYTASVYGMETEKSRSLENIFSMNGKKITCKTGVFEEKLRSCLIVFEGAMDHAFMHPNWIDLAPTWLEAVKHCKRADNFRTVLSIFQACVKKVVFKKDWHKEVSHMNCERNGWHESDHSNEIHHSNGDELGIATVQIAHERPKSIRERRKSTATEKRLIEIIHHELICSQANAIISAIKNSNHFQNEFKLCHCELTKCEYCLCKRALYAKCETFKRRHQYIINTIVFELVEEALPQLKLKSAKGSRINRRSTETDTGCELCQIKSAEKIDLGCIHRVPIELMSSSLKYPDFHEMANACTLPDVAFQIQTLWNSLRWCDMNAKPAALRNTDAVKKDIILIRQHGRFSEKTSYLKSTKSIRFECINPNVQLHEDVIRPNPKGYHLRSRVKQKSQYVAEELEWIAERNLDLCHIKFYYHKFEKEASQNDVDKQSFNAVDVKHGSPNRLIAPSETNFVDSQVSADQTTSPMDECSNSRVSTTKIVSSGSERSSDVPPSRRFRGIN